MTDASTAPAIKGVIAPILTPFEADGAVAGDLWTAHAAWVLGQGAHYLSPFGTTGEALSVGLDERKAALEALIEAGLPAARMMPGTGLCALPDTIELTRHAMGLGCAGVMTLPPFFYKGAGEDGYMRYFEALIAAVDDPRLRVCLYHIPQNSGVPVSPALAARLNRAFPETVVAYKDSSGDWENTAAVLEAAPGLAVFPGSESFLTRGLAAGGAGCISASCNLNSAAIRAVFEAATGQAPAGALAAMDAGIKSFRDAVQSAGLIGAMKAALAVRYDDPRWLNLRAPHLNATRAEGAALLDALGAAGAHIGPGAVPA